MQAFLQALPRPLCAKERAWFGALYFKQPHLGGLPLILLRDRFDLLRGAALDIMAAPEETGPIGVLLRLLHYYEEMVSQRREVDRGYRRRGHHREASGRVARTFPLGFEKPGPRDEPPNELFQEIAVRLVEGRDVLCSCPAGGTRTARLLGGGDDDEVIVIVVECDGCDLSDRIEVARQEFDRIGREVLESKTLRSGGGVLSESDE
jgi:hypothetical protein